VQQYTARLQAIQHVTAYADQKAVAIVKTTADEGVNHHSNEREHSIDQFIQEKYRKRNSGLNPIMLNVHTLKLIGN
jgi:hypothetical protein